MIVFKKVLELNSNFKGGIKSEGFMGRMKNWFYYGFTKRHNLSHVRISGASRKLPQGWEAKVQQIITRVARHQVESRSGTTLIPAICDERMVNTDHVPVYRDMPGNYTWGERGSGGRQISTGGAEKERFTVQLSCTKSGKKLKPFIIFKGASLPKEGNPRRGTVAYELRYLLEDNAGNEYPEDEDVYLTCSKTANSNGELTVKILEEVILPGIEVEEGGIHRGCVLVDDFKGHSKDIVKEYVHSLRSSNNDGNDDSEYDLVAFEIMSGGITPKAQPIDAFIGKVFKGNYRDLYDNYMLSAPLNERGQPIAPTRQMCATWVVQAWSDIPEELIRKSWEVCGYKSISDLNNVEGSANTVIEYNQNMIVEIMEAAGGQQAVHHILNSENDVGEAEEEDDDEGSWVLPSNN